METNCAEMVHVIRVYPFLSFTVNGIYAIIIEPKSIFDLLNKNVRLL